MSDVFSEIFFEQELFGNVADMVGTVSRFVVDDGPEIAMLGGSAVAGVAGIITALSAAGVVTAPVAAGAGVVAAAATAVAAGGGLAMHLRDASLTVDDVTGAAEATVSAVDALASLEEKPIDSADVEVSEMLR